MTNSNEIIFKKIRVRNFLSIKDIEFNFETHSGMNYIFGHNKDVGKEYAKNGAGKSALFGDALLFALFGKTGKNLKKVNIVNRIVGKKCVGEVWFTTNGKEYHIINGASPTFCTIEVKIDGEWENISKSTMVESQTYLTDEILRSTYLMFKKMNVLSIGDNESIYEMSKASKRDFIENVFNLNVFGEMFKMVKVDYNKLDKIILQEQAKFTQLEKDVIIYSEKIKTFQKEKDKSIASLNSQIKEITKQNKSLKSDSVDIGSEISKFKDGKWKLFEKYKTVRDTRNKEENILIESEVKRDVDGENVAKYENIYNMICDCCKGKLDDSIGFTDNKTALMKLEVTIKTSKKKIETIKTALKTITQKMETIDNAIDKLEAKREQYSKSLRLIEFNNVKLELLNENLTVEQDKTSSFEDLYENYNKEKNELYTALSKNLEQRKYFRLLKSILSEDGVKKHIIATLINALNNRISSYLEEMGSEYTVIFDPNFECKFWTTTGECEYNNFSAGEKMRLNHATMFAFQDIISTQGNLKTNLLFCDELIDVSVDTVAIQAFLGILKRKTEEGQTIYLISHREAVSEDEFDNIIEIKKEGGFTQIVSDPQGLALKV